MYLFLNMKYSLVFLVLFSIYHLIQAGNSTCLTGSTPFELSTFCSQGYYCPLYNESDSTTYPVQCAATDDCIIDRLQTKFCPPQGTYEPVPCEKGFYCPTPTVKLTCPKDHFCPLGQYKPIKCGLMTTCEEGSYDKFEYSSIIILIIVDVGCILFFFLIIRWRDRQRKLRDEKYLILKNPNSYLPPMSSPEAIETGVLEPQQSIASEIICKGFQKAQDHLPNFHLRFQNLSLSIEIVSQSNITNQKQRIKKVLLKGVTGTLEPGKVTAILGPSGAGKTTFLNTMLGNIESTWERGGKLEINGVEEEIGRFRKIMGYVPQEDIMHRDLTVYENIRYSAMIRLPYHWTSEMREDHVNAILHAMKLYEVRDILIGDELRRGISGGQRKRVNIAIELAAAPQLLLLDEPTSGLDSNAAMTICQVLRELASISKITVAMVIHQPRIEIWNQLDQLLLLAPGGLTVYQGSQEQVIQYFSTNCQQTIQPNDNPSDALMDSIALRGEEFVQIWNSIHGLTSGKQESTIIPPNNTQSFLDDPRKVHAMEVSQYIPLEQEVLTEEEVEEEKETDKVVYTPFPQIELRKLPNFLQQSYLAFERNLWKQSNNLSSLYLEIGLAIFAGGVMGGLATVSYQGILTAPYTLLSPTPLDGLIRSFFFNVGLCVSLAASSAGVSVFGEEQIIYRREVASGHHHFAYYFGVVMAQYPRLFLDSLHFAALFHIESQPLTSFSTFFWIVFLIYVAIYGIAFIVNMVVQRKNAALLSVVVSLFISSMTGKGGIPEAIQYLSPSRWGTEIIFSIETDPYVHIMEVDEISAKNGGYVRNRLVMDFCLMFCTGVLYRLIAYALMRFVDRKIIRS